MGNQFLHSKILIVERLHHLFAHKWDLSKLKTFEESKFFKNVLKKKIWNKVYNI